jgi:hypothetical protein
MGQVKQVTLPLGLELVPDIVKLADDHIHFLEVEFGQGVELLNVRKHLNQLLKSLDKLVELVEDLCF